MSLLNSSYTDTHHPSSAGGNLRDMPSSWPATAGAHFQGDWNFSSLLASVMHDCAPSCVDENGTGDGRDSSADFCVADLPHICITPDGLTAAYGHLSGTGDHPTTSSMVSQTLPQGRYNGHHATQSEGSGEGRHLHPDFRQVSIPEPRPAPSQSAGYGVASQCNPHRDVVPLLEFEAPWSLGLPTSTKQQPPASDGAAQKLTVPLSMNDFTREEGDAADRWAASTPSQSPMASDGTVSSAWRRPMVDVTEFVDLSDFLSPENDLELQTSTAQGHTMMASTLETTDSLGDPTAFGIRDMEKMRMNEQGELRRCPGTIVSVHQDRLTLEPVKTQLAGPSFVAPSNPASSSYLLASTVEQLHDKWKSASPSFISPDLHPPRTLDSATDPAPSFPLVDHEKLKGVPANPLAPVTPEKPRKRIKRNRSHKQEEDQSQQNPADSSNCSKLQKWTPPVELNFAFQQVAHLQSDLRPGGMVFAATKDTTKAGDHVARERRRRDLMNSRYLALEALLPKLPFRRDRYSIVEDTKLYVKGMELQLADLEATRKDCQARLEAAKVAEGAKQREQKKAAVPEPAAAAAAKLCPPADAGVPYSSMSKDLNVGVVMDQKDEGQEVVVSVQCRSSSGAKLFGSLLRAMEKLQLDVSQFSTSKSAHYFFCNAVCKPQQHVVWNHLSRDKVIQEMVTTLLPLSKVARSTETPS